MTNEKTWRHKAHKIIGEISYAAWERANTKKNGARYKKHRAYTVPELATKLIKCLDKNDEVGAKRIFIYELQTVND